MSPSSLDPEKQYRKLVDDLAISDTIANRVDLAEECLALGKFEEALLHYENALSRPMGDEPAYALGKARARIRSRAPAGCGRDARLVAAALARLSVGGRPSALCACARGERPRGRGARRIPGAVPTTYPGAEARVRFAMLLQTARSRRRGRSGCAPRFSPRCGARPNTCARSQAEWIAAAERALRA